MSITASMTPVQQSVRVRLDAQYQANEDTQHQAAVGVGGSNAFEGIHIVDAVQF